MCYFIMTIFSFFKGVELCVCVNIFNIENFLIFFAKTIQISDILFLTKRTFMSSADSSDLRRASLESCQRVPSFPFINASSHVLCDLFNIRGLICSEIQLCIKYNIQTFVHPKCRLRLNNPKMILILLQFCQDECLFQLMINVIRYDQ